MEILAFGKGSGISLDKLCRTTQISSSHFPFIIQTLSVLTRSDKLSFYSHILVDSHSNSTANNVLFIDFLRTDRPWYENLAI